MSLPLVLTEQVISFREAVGRCPSVAGSKPKRQTIYFWRDTGILCGTQRVKLECARLGGRWVTSVEALERFFAATTGGEVAEPVKTPAQIRKSADAAMERIRKAFAKV